MHQVDPNLTRRKGRLAALAIAAMASASLVTVAVPATANADPEPAPPVPTTAASPPSTAAAPPAPATPVAPPPPAAANTPNAQPGDPNAAPPPADPNAPPPPVIAPNAPQPVRIDNPVGGFSFALPAGWVESDAAHLDYGSALLSKTTGDPPFPGQPPPVANDTRIVLGRLDQKLYASAEATDSKAAARLGSDMGEFYMPYPGTRINQETVSLDANGVSGSASYYEVKFSDPSKPNGQIWTGVIGSPAANAPDAGPPQRWFVVWLGTTNNPVDKGAAKALAESIRPLVAPPPAPAPAPAEPAPAPAPAGEVAPTPTTPTPQRTLPA
ncbi:adhesin Apa [Mycobacterium tuberculosis]|uniref:adhesin Apa n=1 Tax=Mycobacterium tuberculosis TaxID=1773 RepID=UPI0008A918B9|nr:adhesin Apa [Mycobacterium tuberculosis]